jgi:glycosyltransferase involved in cell wall biosynthesis
VRLTIGMATYKDPQGVFFTLQALRLYHDLEDAELLVVDNSKAGCAATAQTCKKQEARYVHRPKPQGTAAPRDAVFREAKGKVVCCVDSHVLLTTGSLRLLLAHFDNTSNSHDLVQGPLLYDSHQGVATHFDTVWGDGMYGKWARAWYHRDVGLFACRNIDEFVNFVAVDGRPFTIPELCHLPPIPRSADDRLPWAGHEQALARAGCRLPATGPIEIPMQGLGLFAMRRDAWPGFNPRFRGFGGEEGYLHEKVRRRGGRCVCLPGLRWVHRFRAEGEAQPYPNTVDDRLFNYLVGWRELGLDVKPVIGHFVGRLPRKQLERVIKEACHDSGTDTEGHPGHAAAPVAV